jgi:hypothetical protein
MMTNLMWVLKWWLISVTCLNHHLLAKPCLALNIYLILLSQTFLNSARRRQRLSQLLVATQVSNLFPWANEHIFWDFLSIQFSRRWGPQWIYDPEWNVVPMVYPYKRRCLCNRFLLGLIAFEGKHIGHRFYCFHFLTLRCLYILWIDRLHSNQL